jgi:hypothetical protein
MYGLIPEPITDRGTVAAEVLKCELAPTCKQLNENGLGDGLARVDSNHAALRRPSSRRNQLISGFELAQIWSTNSKLLILNGLITNIHLIEPPVVEGPIVQRSPEPLRSVPSAGS